MRQSKKQNHLQSKKGFTLVELIVALVILAFLAAITIPALSGWTDKARQKQFLLECRSCVVAAQGQATEAYGANIFSEWADQDNQTDRRAKIAKLAGVEGTITEDLYDAESAHVTRLVYVINDQTITYDHGSYFFKGEEGGQNQPGGSGDGNSSSSGKLGYDAASKSFSNIKGVFDLVIEKTGNIRLNNNGTGRLDGTETGELIKVLTETIDSDMVNTNGSEVKVYSKDNRKSVGFSLEVEGTDYLFLLFDNGTEKTYYQITGKNSLDYSILSEYWDKGVAAFPSGNNITYTQIQ